LTSAFRGPKELQMSDELRARILAQSRAFIDQQVVGDFVPGETYVSPSVKVVDADDCAALVDASLDMWLTAGRYANECEREMARRWGVKHCRLTNSGSSANLLAFSALTSPTLENPIRPGDEVITVAAGFPTTVNPIVQNGALPVFVDADIDTHNVDVDALEAAIGPKTKAVMLAHALGNPFDVERVAALCAQHDLHLIEDCCDAFGAEVGGRTVGTFGVVSTLSCYPAHHITMGEGGAVFTDDREVAKRIESFRDWGRDCYCPPGRDNTCKKRFEWEFEQLPAGYDHKYVYSHIGYNLKVTDMQAALGLSQLKKLDSFIERRNKNHAFLTELLVAAGLDEIFHIPTATPGTKPSWFGYLLTVRDDVGVARSELTRALENAGIGTRLLFAGNLTKQPGYADANYRVAGSLERTDKLMRDAFWVGCWPGLDERHMTYIAERIAALVGREL